MALDFAENGFHINFAFQISDFAFSEGLDIHFAFMDTLEC